MAEKLSLSLVWCLLLSGGPPLLYKEELGTQQAFFPLTAQLALSEAAALWEPSHAGGF